MESKRRKYSHKSWTKEMGQTNNNGNLTAGTSPVGTSVTGKYDVLDRLVEITDAFSGNLTTYAYDAMDRRIRKTISSPGTPAVTTNYYYDGNRVIEERDDTGVTQATYVYGLYIDEVLNMRRGGSYYYHADDMYNVMAITDIGGNVVERYEYEDYGKPTITGPSGAPQPGSSVNNPYLFNGRRYDKESGLYYYRSRYMDPRAGRFTSRDPIGIWDDSSNLGNGNAYAGNSPWTNLDPLGLESSGRFGNNTGPPCKCPYVMYEEPCHPRPGFYQAMRAMNPGGQGGGGTGSGIGDVGSSRYAGAGLAAARSSCGGMPMGEMGAKFSDGTVTGRRQHGYFAPSSAAIREGGRTVGAGQIARRGQAKQLKGYLMFARGGGDHNGQVTITVGRANGGRHTPFHNKYRPQFNFNAGSSYPDFMWTPTRGNGHKHRTAKNAMNNMR